MEANKNMTVAALVRQTYLSCWAGTKSEDTQHNTALEIAALLGPTTLVRQVNERMLMAQLQPALRQLKPNTQNRKRAVWHRMWSLALELGVIDRIPSWKRTRGGHQRERFLTVAEETALLLQLPAPYNHFCSFLLNTGLRVGEALALKWHDIQAEGNCLLVRCSKNGKPRTVPLTASACEALKHATLSPSCLPWCAISHSSLNKVFVKARAAIGLEGDTDVTPHVLRHTWATRLVQKGLPLASVSRLLGHSSIAMTMRYAHHDPAECDRARRLLEGDDR